MAAAGEGTRKEVRQSATSLSGGDTTMPDWIALLVSWVPFVVLILVWIFLSRQLGFRQNQWKGFYKDQLTEMQRTNALLDRIALALEKRAERP
jgi:hypothetical protein